MTFPMPTEDDELACLVLETSGDSQLSTGSYGFSYLSNLLLKPDGRELLSEVLVSSRPQHPGLLKILGIQGGGPHRFAYLSMSAGDYLSSVKTSTRAADLGMFIETAEFEILFCLRRDKRLLDMGARRVALLFSDSLFKQYGLPEEVSRAAKSRIKENLVVVCFSQDMRLTYILGRSFPTGEPW